MDALSKEAAALLVSNDVSKLLRNDTMMKSETASLCFGSHFFGSREKTKDTHVSHTLTNPPLPLLQLVKYVDAADFIRFFQLEGALLIFLPFSPAYRLKKCPPPPVVENAEVIYEDEDFQIGNRLIND